MNYTKQECQEMYLDWVNNFLSTNRFAEYYSLKLSEVENILDVGRCYNMELGEQYYQKTGRIKQNK